MRIERILEVGSLGYKRPKRTDVSGIELEVMTDTSDAVVFHHDDPRQNQKQKQEQPEQELSDSEQHPLKKTALSTAQELPSTETAERVSVVA